MLLEGDRVSGGASMRASPLQWRRALRHPRLPARRLRYALAHGPGVLCTWNRLLPPGTQDLYSEQRIVHPRGIRNQRHNGTRLHRRPHGADRAHHYDRRLSIAAAVGSWIIASPIRGRTVACRRKPRSGAGDGSGQHICDLLLQTTWIQRDPHMAPLLFQWGGCAGTEEDLRVSLERHCVWLCVQLPFQFRAR